MADTSSTSPFPQWPVARSKLPSAVANIPKDHTRGYKHSKRVNHYLVGRTLGVGSFAKVKEAFHGLVGEKVAMKVIDKRKALQDSYVSKNLRREAKLLQMVRHPNIVRLLEIIETDNNYYLVIELCSAELMCHIYYKIHLEEEETRKYMRQIVSAVDHLHRAGIIHRDIKIENLLLDRNMDVKIIDFGLSNEEFIEGEHGQVVHCSTQCGSPAYAAPELLGFKKYGPEVDIWTIGVDMYAMLTGCLPYTVDPFNITTLHAKMLENKMNPIPDSISESCKDLIHRLLTPSPEKRIRMPEIMAHPWMNEGHNLLVPAPYPNSVTPSGINDDIIEHMVCILRLKDSEEKLRQELLANRSTSASAVYHLLTARLARYQSQFQTKMTCESEDDDSRATIHYPSQLRCSSRYGPRIHRLSCAPQTNLSNVCPISDSGLPVNIEELTNGDLLSAENGAKSMPERTLDTVESMPEWTVDTVKSMPERTLDTVESMPEWTVDTVKSMPECYIPCTEVEMVQEERFTFSRNEECTFDRRKGQGFILHIPKGAVSSRNCTVTVKSCVVSQSTPEFIFPVGSNLVSGVYHIAASRKLSKPVSFEIQHCSVIRGDSQHNQLEVAIADSTIGPPYRFKPIAGGSVRVFDSYVEVKLTHFSFLSSFSRVFRKAASIRYCGLVCCLKSSELMHTWEYHIVLIRNLQLCIKAIRKEYAAAESVQELSVDFEEGDALTLDNVSVEGTTTSGGWHVATKWDPARIEKVEADKFTPGRSIPQCCVLASYTGDATTAGALRHVLNFSGTRKPKSYLLCRDAQSEQSASVSSDRPSRPSMPTPEIDASSVDDSPLGEQDLHCILSTTIKVAARWKFIGDLFHLSPATLETIGKDCSDSKACLREVILRWLQNLGYDHRQYGPPTWRWVVEAVGSPGGGDNPELARRIASQHPEEMYIDVSGVDDSPLGEEDLHCILSTTIKVAARWKLIGDSFQLSPGTLETIREDCSDSKACLREVILRWLQNLGYVHRYGPPTWRCVVKAVGNPAGGDNPKLARKIASQHPKAPATSDDVTSFSPSSPRKSD